MPDTQSTDLMKSLHSCTPNVAILHPHFGVSGDFRVPSVCSSIVDEKSPLHSLWERQPVRGQCV